MGITVGAIGFLHVTDVALTFERGAVASVEVRDLLYTGRFATLLEWALEFARGRLRGLRLRERIRDVDEPDTRSPRFPARADRDDAATSDDRGDTAVASMSTATTPPAAANHPLIQRARSSLIHRSAGKNQETPPDKQAASSSSATPPPTPPPPGAPPPPSPPPPPPRRSPLARASSGSGSLASLDSGSAELNGSFALNNGSSREKQTPAASVLPPLAAMKLEIPILAAGVRVKLREAPASEGSPRTMPGGEDGDLDEPAASAASPRESPGRLRSKPGETRSKPASSSPPVSFATWQLAKGLARFLRVSFADVEVDATSVGGGAHGAPSVAASARFARGTGLQVTLECDACESEWGPPNRGPNHGGASRDDADGGVVGGPGGDGTRSREYSTRDLGAARDAAAGDGSNGEGFFGRRVETRRVALRAVVRFDRATKALAVVALDATVAEVDVDERRIASREDEDEDEDENQGGFPRAASLSSSGLEAFLRRAPARLSLALGAARVRSTSTRVVEGGTTRLVAALASASFEIRRETADERRRAAARRDRTRNRNRLFRGNDESSEDVFFASVSSSGSDARAADDLAVASATWARLEVAAPTNDDELISRGGAESRGGVSSESSGGVSAKSRGGVSSESSGGVSAKSRGGVYASSEEEAEKKSSEPSSGAARWACDASRVVATAPLAADPKPKPNSATATGPADLAPVRVRASIAELVAEAHPRLRAALVDRFGSGVGAGEPEAGSPGPAGSPKSTRPWDVEVRLEDGAHALRAYAETEAGRGEGEDASVMTVVASARATAAAFGFARDGTKKIVGAGRNRNPGVVPAPTVSSAFEGFEIALAPDSRSDRFGTGETTGKGASSKPPGGALLRTLLRADRFGVSRAPTPPGVSEPPDAWAAADGGSSDPTATRGGDDDAAAAAGPGPVEIELVGATLDVAAEAAEATDARARAAARAFAAFFGEGGDKGARRRKPKARPNPIEREGEGVEATTARAAAAAVTLVDARVLVRAKGGAFRLAAPHATLRREGRVVSSSCAGVSLGFVAGAEAATRDAATLLDAAPETDGNDATNIFLADRVAGTFRDDERPISEPPPGEDHPPMSTPARPPDLLAIEGEGVALRWRPDAHFAAAEMVAAARASASAFSESTVYDSRNEQKEARGAAKKRTPPRVRATLSRVALSAAVAPGASGACTAESLTIESSESSEDFGVAARRPFVSVNGHQVAAASRVAWNPGASLKRGVPKEGRGVNAEAEAEAAEVFLSVDDARASLPWGLDLGDARERFADAVSELAARGAFDFGRESSDPTPQKNPDGSAARASKNDRRTPFPRALTVRFVGDAVFEVHDSPLARCLRGKAAFLAPALAAARAADAADASTSRDARAPRDRAAEYDARVRAYAADARRVAAHAASLATRVATESDPDAERVANAAAAGRFAFGDATTLRFDFDLEDSRSKEKPSKPSSPASSEPAACARARRADAPWSDAVALAPPAFAATIDWRASNVRATLPHESSSRTVFAAKDVALAGLTVVARQATSEAPPGSATATEKNGRSSSSSPRPPLKAYVDWDATLRGVSGAFSPALEPALASVARELASRCTPPPPGGRLKAAAASRAAHVAAARAGWRGGGDPSVDPGDPAPTLPPWDVARALFRGKVRVKVEGGFGYAMLDPGGMGRGFLAEGGCTGIFGDDEGGAGATRGVPGDEAFANESGGGEFLGGAVRADALEIDLSRAGRARVRAANLEVRAVREGGGGGGKGKGGGDFGGGDFDRVSSPASSSPASSSSTNVLASAPRVSMDLRYAWRTLGGAPFAGGQDHHRHDSATGAALRPPHAHFSVGCALECDVAFRGSSREPGDDREPSSSASSPSEASPVSKEDASPPPALAFAVHPSSLGEWRAFGVQLATPRGAWRRAWRLPPLGTGRKPRHPMARPLPAVVDSIVLDVTVGGDAEVRHDDETAAARAFFPSSEGEEEKAAFDDPARGLRLRARGLRVRVGFEGSEGEGNDARAPLLRVAATNGGSNARARSLRALEVSSSAIRATLPEPSDALGEALAARSATPTPTGRGGFSRGVGPPGDLSRGTGDDAAVLEMLLGGGGGVGARGEGREGGGAFSGVLGPNATDPSVVLETRGVRLERRVGPPPANALEDDDEKKDGDSKRKDGESKGDKSKGDHDDDSDSDSSHPAWLHVSVREPRFALAASRRDALIRWVRDAYRAALAPRAPPRKSVAELRRVAAGAPGPGPGPSLSDASRRETTTEPEPLDASAEPPLEPLDASAEALVEDASRVRGRSESWDAGEQLLGGRARVLPAEGGGLRPGYGGAPPGAASGSRSGSDPARAHRRARSEMPAGALETRDHLGVPGVEGSNPTARATRAPSNTPLPPRTALAEDAPPPNPVVARPATTVSDRSRARVFLVADVDAPQMNFEGKDRLGRFLVAATSGRVVGTLFQGSGEGSRVEGSSPAPPRRRVAVTLTEAQAYVAPTDVDVRAGVQWLSSKDYSAEGLRRTSKDFEGVSAAAGTLLRRVFKPCEMDLACTTLALGEGPAESRAAPLSAPTAFALRSPDVDADLDADQFAALADAVASLFLAPLADDPSKKPLESAADAAYALLNDDEAAGVVPTRRTNEREDLEYSLQNERASAAVRAAAASLAEHVEATRLRREALADRRVAERLSRLTRRETRAVTREDDAASEAAAEKDVYKNVSFERERLRMLLPRSSFSLAAARALADAAAASALRVGSAVREAELAKRPSRRRPAIKLTLAIDRFRWAMRERRGGTFLVAAFRGFALTRSRHHDSSGVTRLELGDARLDAPPPKTRGAMDAEEWARAVARAEAPVLARWNPDEETTEDKGSKAADEGGSKASEGGSKAADEGGSKASEGGSKAADEGSKASSHPPLVAVRALRAASPPEAPVWDHIEVSVHPFDLRVEQSTYERVTAYLFREKDTKLDGGGAESDPSLGRSLPSAASGPSEPPEASRERAREAMLLGKKKKPSPSPREHLTKPPREPASRLATRAGRPAPLRVPGAAETAAAVGSFPEHSARTATLSCVPGVAKKTVVVRYVRVNDVRLRVSYDGKPRAFHEVRLFLDAFTHHGFRGRWRELVDKIKGGFAWSALKSVAGLQPRSAKRVHKGAHHPADKGRLPPPRGAAGPGPGLARGDSSSSSAVVLGPGSSSAGGDASVPPPPPPPRQDSSGFELRGYAEELDALGSPTAAAMVAESDGLVVSEEARRRRGGPRSRSSGSRSLWSAMFGGGRRRSGGASSSTGGSASTTTGGTTTTSGGTTAAAAASSGGGFKDAEAARRRRLAEDREAVAASWGFGGGGRRPTR